MNEAKSVYDQWLDGSFKAPGRFQAQLFQAYQFGDGTNRKKLKSVYPEWFMTSRRC